MDMNSEYQKQMYIDINCADISIVILSRFIIRLSAVCPSSMGIGSVYRVVEWLHSYPIDQTVSVYDPSYSINNQLGEDPKWYGIALKYLHRNNISQLHTHDGIM